MTKTKDEKPQGSDKPSSDKPNPNIIPPTYDVVTEGYDPSKVQTKKGGEPAKKKQTFAEKGTPNKCVQPIGGK